MGYLFISATVGFGGELSLRKSPPPYGSTPTNITKVLYLNKQKSDTKLCLKYITDYIIHNDKVIRYTYTKFKEVFNRGQSDGIN